MLLVTFTVMLVASELIVPVQSWNSFPESGTAVNVYVAPAAIFMVAGLGVTLPFPFTVIVREGAPPASPPPEKVLPVVALPSLTLTVTLPPPLFPDAGVIVTVRLAPLPPKAIPDTGTTPGFEEVAATVRLPAGVSTSPTVNAIAALDPSCEIV